jgi:uncharacterized protein YndB with AHSA1/START domain
MSNIPLRALTEQDIILTRVLDAPRELVWKAFSEAERLAQWWGPQGCDLRVLNLEFQPGGVYHYAMQTPGGEMYGKLDYRKIVPQESIIYVVSFADTDGNTIRAPFSETWPLEILSETAFTEQDGKTLIVMASSPQNATEEEGQTFEQGLEGMKQGTNGMLDQLAAYLANA